MANFLIFLVVFFRFRQTTHTTLIFPLPYIHFRRRFAFSIFVLALFLNFVFSHFPKFAVFLNKQVPLALELPRNKTEVPTTCMGLSADHFYRVVN